MLSRGLCNHVAFHMLCDTAKLHAGAQAKHNHPEHLLLAIHVASQYRVLDITNTWFLN